VDQASNGRDECADHPSLTELERRSARACAAYAALKKKLDLARWREAQPLTEPVYTRAEWADLEASLAALEYDCEAARSALVTGRIAAVSVYELEMAYMRTVEERERVKQTRAANALANASFWPASVYPNRPRPVHIEWPSLAELDAAVEAAHRAWWPVRTEAVRRLMQRVANEPPAAQTAELERLKRVKGIELDQELAVYATRLAALEATATAESVETPRPSTMSGSATATRDATRRLWYDEFAEVTAKYRRVHGVGLSRRGLARAMDREYSTVDTRLRALKRAGYDIEKLLAGVTEVAGAKPGHKPGRPAT
jgi:hypothetical protein